MIKRAVVTVFFLFSSYAFCIDLGLNKSIYVQDGDIKRDGIATINGCIIIGKNCRVRGTCSSINGMIDIGSHSQVNRLQTVNGGIRINEETQVIRDVKSVNGPISCREGVVIQGKIETVNGPVELSGTRIQKDVTTFNGNMVFDLGSIIEGDVIVKDSHHGQHKRKEPIIIKVKNNSRVMGDVIVEDDDIPVKIYLMSGGEIVGHVYNAEVISR